MRAIGTALFGLAIAASTNAWANIMAIAPTDFLPNAQVITFETGTTELPTLPGVTFLGEAPSDTSPWYSGSGNFNGFFGNQGWSNEVSSTYSDLGIQFAMPVQAVGGYVGNIPNFTNQHPTVVTVELFDTSLTSLGTVSVSLPATLNAPVFFGFTADAPIARFRMTGNNTGFFSVDNFTFGSLQSHQVPEPGDTLVLTFIGTGVIFSLRASRLRPAIERVD